MNGWHVFEIIIAHLDCERNMTIREASLPEICREMYFVVRGQELDVLYWYPIYNRRGWLAIFCRMVQGEREVQADGA